MQSVLLVLRWAWSLLLFAVLVALPVIVIIQCAIFMFEFHRRHGSAPYPVSPSKGVAVAVDQSNTNDASEVSEEVRPLRLLLVGDSLAAGVGCDTATPVLPTTIAKSLSRKLGGRPVHWTCFGTPGATTNQIIHNIQSLAKGGSSKETSSETSASTTSSETASEIASDDTSRCSDYDPEDPPEQLQGNLQLNDVSAGDTTGEKFDIAIVPTAINDVKESFVPFLMDKDRRKAMKERPKESACADSNLEKIMRALECVMDLDLEDASSAEQENKDCPDDEEALGGGRTVDTNFVPGSRPIVVFPALPILPIPIFAWRPLRWFSLPLVRRSDSFKKALAKRFPKNVLFVERLTSDDVVGLVTGGGPLWEERRAEQVLCDTNDVPPAQSIHTEKIIRAHIDEWAHTLPGETYDPENRSYCCGCLQPAAGRSLISVDRIHPNSDGYDFWGRHIANAITERMTLSDDCTNTAQKIVPSETTDSA